MAAADPTRSPRGPALVHPLPPPTQAPAAWRQQLQPPLLAPKGHYDHAVVVDWKAAVKAVCPHEEKESLQLSRKLALTQPHYYRQWGERLARREG